MQRVGALTLLTVVCTFVLHGQWVEQKSGTTTDLTDIAILDSVTAIAVGRDGSIVRTTDEGQTWINLPLPPLFFHPWNAVSFYSATSGAVAGDYGRVATTIDGGENWLWHDVPGGRTCLSVLQTGPSTMYVGDDSGWVHRSLDSGNTWTSTHVSIWPIRSLFAWTGFYVWGLPVYALTPFSLCLKTGFPTEVWIETILQPFMGLGSQAFRGVFSYRGGPGFIVGVFGDLRAAPAIVRKSIQDSIWRPITSSLQGDGTLFGVSAPTTNSIYVCGDHGMIFHSTNGGDVWSAASVPTTQRLRAVSFDDEMSGFAVGDSGTILHTSNGGLAVGDDKNLLPAGPELYQNFPNPFNPNSNIRYSISKVRHVTLVVYDLLGREVATLVDEVKEPGTYTVQFHASSLASGIYMYRLRVSPAGGLQSEDFIATRKLILLK